MKVSVDILFFDRDALAQTETDKKLKGQLYLEKQPRGKFLCFKKADVVISILLTKKMYKSLNRFAYGVRVERFYDVEEYEENDQDDELTEDDVYYIRNREIRDRRYGNQTTLPAIINTPPKPRVLAPFIIQVFQYVGKK